MSGTAGGTRTWAQAMCRPAEAVILDTETTDLYGAIIEVAVIDAATGTTLINTLVDPGPISLNPEAITVHGITAQQLVGAPTWPQVWPPLAAATAGRRVLAYNAAYDHAVIAVDCARHHLHPRHLGNIDTWDCLMNRRCADLEPGHRLALDGGHRALDDAHAARTVLHQLAAEVAA